MHRLILFNTQLRKIANFVLVTSITVLLPEPLSEIFTDHRKSLTDRK